MRLALHVAVLPAVDGKGRGQGHPLHRHPVGEDDRARVALGLGQRLAVGVDEGHRRQPVRLRVAVGDHPVVRRVPRPFEEGEAGRRVGLPRQLALPQVLEAHAGVAQLEGGGEEVGPGAQVVAGALEVGGRGGHPGVLAVEDQEGAVREVVARGGGIGAEEQRPLVAHPAAEGGDHVRAERALGVPGLQPVGLLDRGGELLREGIARPRRRLGGGGFLGPLGPPAAGREGQGERREEEQGEPAALPAAGAEGGRIANRHVKGLLSKRRETISERRTEAPRGTSRRGVPSSGWHPCCRC